VITVLGNGRPDWTGDFNRIFIN